MGSQQSSQPSYGPWPRSIISLESLRATPSLPSSSKRQRTPWWTPLPSALSSVIASIPSAVAVATVHHRHLSPRWWPLIVPAPAESYWVLDWSGMWANFLKCECCYPSFLVGREYNPNLKLNNKPISYLGENSLAPRSSSGHSFHQWPSHILCCLSGKGSWLPNWQQHLPVAPSCLLKWVVFLRVKEVLGCQWRQDSQLPQQKARLCQKWPAGLQLRCRRPQHRHCRFSFTSPIPRTLCFWL